MRSKVAYRFCNRVKSKGVMSACFLPAGEFVIGALCEVYG